MAGSNNTNPVQHQVQEMFNNSWDDTFAQNTVEILGFDGQNLVRMLSDTLRVAHYNDATYDYYCFAAPGTLLSATKWLIKRVTSDGAVDYPNGSNAFNQAATNLATVQGYTYS